MPRHTVADAVGGLFKAAYNKTVVLAACYGLAIIAPALADGPYSDVPTSAWFKSLHSPQQGFFCCDQADCKEAASDYRADGWWALSNRMGVWVKIRDNQITRDQNGNIAYSIFPQAVLCEGDPIMTPDGMIPRVFCYAPPPNGF